MVHVGGKWGRWAKKIRRTRWYFGPVVLDAKDFGTAAVLDRSHREKEAREQGRESRPAELDDVTVRDLLNKSLVA